MNAYINSDPLSTVGARNVRGRIFDYRVPTGMSCVVERVNNIMETVNTFTELKRLSICIDAILFMSSSSLLGRFERKVGEVLDNRDQTKSLDQKDFNSLVKVSAYEKSKIFK